MRRRKRRKPLNTHMLIEAIGYAGSLLILVSMLMTSVYKLRIINTLGSLIFTAYALLIRSYPTAFMNFCLVLINLHFLWKMTHTDRDFDLVKTGTDDAFLQYLIDSHREDIRACFPGIPLDFSDATDAYIICCKGLPVGVTLGEEQDGVLNLALDYTIPEYRDFSVGRFLAAELKEQGIRKLCYGGPVENHLPYLQKLGYVKNGELYEKML